MMSTMDPRHLDPYTETVVLDCARCGAVHDVHDDATDGDPCPRCASQATTALVSDLQGAITRPYLPPFVPVTITTTWFAARPTLNQRSHIRVTGPGGTDLMPTGYSSGYMHRRAVLDYLANRGLTAVLGDAVPVPGGSGYVFTIKEGI